MKRIFLLFTLLFFVGSSWAIEPVSVSLFPCYTYLCDSTIVDVAEKGSYVNFKMKDQDFFQIINNMDNETLVTPLKADSMFFGGSTKWSRIGAKKQNARLQYYAWQATNSLEIKFQLCPDNVECYVDNYLEDSNLQKPFLGIACDRDKDASYETCAADGYIAAKNFQKEGVDNFPGFYHLRVHDDPNILLGSLVYNASVFHSTELRDIFKNLNVGARYESTWVSCAANSVYGDDEYNSGTRCKDIAGSDARMIRTEMKFHKLAQLTLNPTNAFEEIYVDTNGHVTIPQSNNSCKKVTVSRRSGVSCVVVNYKYAEENHVKNNELFFYLFYNQDIDTTGMSASSIASEVLWESSQNGKWNKTWVVDDRELQYPYFHTIFPSNTENGTISVFFSEFFLKKLINSRPKDSYDIYATPDLLAFRIYDRNHADSGFYEFLPFTYLKVLPKEHSIGIHPVETTPVGDGSNKDEVEYGVGDGIIGSTTPIDIQYKISSSYSDQEFLKNVSLTVDGAQATKDGKQYCAFTDINGTGATIAVPQYVKYRTSESDFKTVETNCKKDGIDLTPNYTDYDKKAHGEVYWEKINDDDGAMAETKIDLVFPMDDPISTTTTDGSAFEGTAQSKGTLKVTATWNKVN